MLSSITLNGAFRGVSDSLKRISENHLRYTASLILHLAYGHRVNSTDDKYVQLTETAVKETIQSGNPGFQLVDFFPTREFFLLFYLVFFLT